MLPAQHNHGWMALEEAAGRVIGEVAGGYLHGMIADFEVHEVAIHLTEVTRPGLTAYLAWSAAVQRSGAYGISG